MKPGNLIKRKQVSKRTNSSRIFGIILGIYEWNYLVLWPDGSKSELGHEDFEVFYEVIQ